jgi:hypothetical protein
MAKGLNPTAALAKLAQDREALRARTAELDTRERELKVAVAREGATRLATAIAGLNLGEVSKAQAVEFGRHVQRLGLAGSLTRLAAKWPSQTFWNILPFGARWSTQPHMTFWKQSSHWLLRVIRSMSWVISILRGISLALIWALLSTYQHSS